MRSCLVALLLPAFLAAQERQPNETLVALLKELSTSTNQTKTSLAFAAKMLQTKNSDKETADLLAEIAASDNTLDVLLNQAEKSVAKKRAQEARICLDIVRKAYREQVDKALRMDYMMKTEVWKKFETMAELCLKLGDKDLALVDYEISLKCLRAYRTFRFAYYGKRSPEVEKLDLQIDRLQKLSEEKE